MTCVYRFVAMLILSIASFVAPARAVFVDQGYHEDTFIASGFVHPVMPVGQEFTPSISQHVGVRIYFDKIDHPVTAMVSIHEGTIDAPAVAGTEVSMTFGPLITREGPFGNILAPDPIEFLFDQTVGLMPGMVHVLQVRTDDAELLWMTPVGQIILYVNDMGIIEERHVGWDLNHGPVIRGVALDPLLAAGDFAYETLVVPEPGTLLLGLGVGALGWRWRRRYV